MDSENGISRPTEISIFFYLSVCVCLSTCEGEEEVAKTNQAKVLKAQKTYLRASTLHGKLEGNLRFFSVFMLLIVLKHRTQCIRRYRATVLLL